MRCWNRRGEPLYSLASGSLRVGIALSKRPLCYALAGSYYQNTREIYLMNPVDTASSNSSPLAVAQSTQEPSVQAQSSANTAPAASDASAVTKELAAAQASNQTKDTNTETTTLLHKVVESLTTVVQALVSVVTALVGKLSGNKQNAVAEGQSGAQSGSGASTGASSGSASGSAAAGGAGSSSGSAGSTNGTQQPGNQGSSGSSSGAASQGQGGVQSGATTTVGGALFDVTRNDIGQIAVRTLDGYVVRAEGRDQAWSITGPDGRTTRIWGDPHVQESDGGKWDFLNRSTFQFGNNKATVEVVPFGNGATITARLTLYSGEERVTIDGINLNNPFIAAHSRDGKQHDDGLADGVTYKRDVTKTGESWKSNLTGKVM